jgi:hypothetical protein
MTNQRHILELSDCNTTVTIAWKVHEGYFSVFIPGRAGRNKSTMVAAARDRKSLVVPATAHTLMILRRTSLRLFVGGD